MVRMQFKRMAVDPESGKETPFTGSYSTGFVNSVEIKDGIADVNDAGAAWALLHTGKFLPLDEMPPAPIPPFEPIDVELQPITLSSEGVETSAPAESARNARRRPRADATDPEE